MSFQVKHIVGIILVLLSAIGVVLLLTAVAIEPKYVKNGFERKMKNKGVFLINAIEKEEQIVDIIGATKNRLYFRTINPSMIFETDYTLSNKQYEQVRIPNIKKIASQFTSYLDSPYINILAGNLPGIVKVDNDSLHTIYKLPNVFTRSVMLSPHSFILRGFDPTIKREQVFFKVNTLTGLSRKEKGLSEFSKDFGIITDGILDYDSTTRIICYTFYHFNKFLAIDTNLNLLYSANTIAPLKMKPVEIESTKDNSNRNGETFTNVGPKRIFNYSSCVSNGKLFINSLVKADNEKVVDFENNSVIDTYNLNTGSYDGSFYVPSHKRQKLKVIRIYHNFLIGLYKDYIAVYKIL